MLNKDDELHILRLPKITSTFAQDEFLQLSMKVSKINEYGNKHTRYFVLTNKRILLLNKSSNTPSKIAIRRKVPLSFLIAITISSRSFEFILHFKNDYDDDDLRLQTESRSRLIEFIVKTFATEFHKALASFQVSDLNLKKYVVYKQDRHKNLSKLPTVQVNYLNYKPMLDEQHRKTELKKVHQQDADSKMLFGKFVLSLNDFELIKIISEGSISQIVLVKNQKVHTQHIMKCVNRMGQQQVNLDEFIKRFDNYQYHPFLPPLEYCFETEQKYFFIMPLAKCDLFKKLEELKRFDQKQLKFCATELVLAIEHIHGKELIHGDLRLENVMLDQEYHVVLCDFGQLRRERNKQEYYGIPEYTPPETILHKEYEYYSDYWQLGILLYELAYEHPPFIDYEQNMTFDYIVNCQVEFPVTIEVDPALKDLMKELLQKEPTERIGYQMGVSAIQNHSYFASTNWKMAYDRQLVPPDFERKLKLL